MRIAVLGLGHLGCVTCACAAELGHDVVGLDEDESVVADLTAGKPPIFEPGLAELIETGMENGRLTFTTDPRAALAGAELLWVAIDTPVDETDEADVGFVRESIDRISGEVDDDAIVLISSQVPAGFTRGVQQDWNHRGTRGGFAYSPENLRLGKSIDVFMNPERVVIGIEDESQKPALTELLRPGGTSSGTGLHSAPIVWMTIESAEITKHSLNSYLAMSVTFGNEVARLCEKLGGDAREVEEGLRSEPRVGRHARLSPGAAFAGGTLARDLRYLTGFGHTHGVSTALLEGVLRSNEEHGNWTRTKVESLLRKVDHEPPTVAVLGLAYKPGTDSVRRSAAVELCEWLLGSGVRVRVHDPAVGDLPPSLSGVERAPDPGSALDGADIAVIATEWADYATLTARDFTESMRGPVVVDQGWFLSDALSSGGDVTYIATGLDRSSLHA